MKKWHLVIASVLFATACGDGAPDTENPRYEREASTPDAQDAGSGADASTDGTQGNRDASPDSRAADGEADRPVQADAAGEQDDQGSVLADVTTDISTDRPSPDAESSIDSPSVPPDGPADDAASERARDGEQPDRSVDGSDAGHPAGGETDAGAKDVEAEATPACGPCTSPPTDCHATVGRCVEGRCEYSFVEGASCDDGNACTVVDTCSAGKCAGVPMPCTTPPGAVCVGATQLVTYDGSGVCNEGRCVYTKKTVDCGAAGCANNACRTDACAGIVCNSPPSNCFQATGTCRAGSCTYPYQDGALCNDDNACTDGDMCSAGVCVGAPKPCASPPPSTCQDDHTAKIFDALGSCSSGTCSYLPHFVTCSAGCSGGRCVDSGWHFMTSNTNIHLFSVWGSSANAVWAGGDQGTALYFNGSIWQARPTPAEATTQRIFSIHGTAIDNVFALADGKLIHYDGAQWSLVASLPVGSASFHDLPACVFAYGPGDAFVWGLHATTAELYRVQNGVVTKLGTQAHPFSYYGESPYTCGIHVFSPTDVVLAGGSGTVRFNGTTFDEVSNPVIGSSESLYVASLTSIFVMLPSNSVRQWTGSGGFANLTTGLRGTAQAIAGTAANRVFLVGSTTSATDPAHSVVMFYDGLGWTVEPTPVVTPSLNAVWAAASGEVFAVGNSGTILRGP